MPVAVSAPPPPDPVKELQEAIEQALPVLRTEYRELAIRAKVAGEIADGDTMRQAEQVAKDIAAWKKRALRTYEPIKAYFHARHEKWCAEQNKIVKPCETMYASVKKGIKAYIEKVEQERRERQRRDAEAAIAQNRQLQSVAPAGSVLVAAFHTPMPIVNAPAPGADVRLAGSAVSRPMKFEVTDIIELSRAVVSGRVPSDVLMVNEEYLRAQVAKYGTALRYPGVRVFQDTQVSIR
jgi:hypothetical protein